MKSGRIVKLDISMAAAFGILVLLAGPAVAIDVINLEVEDNPAVVTGAAVFADPDDADSIAAAISDGPVTVSGGAVRRVLDTNDFDDVCIDLVWLLQEADKTGRKEDGLKQKQKDNLQIRFVFSDCENEDSEPECSFGSSAAVAVAGCAGAVKIDVSANDVGKVRVKCSDGIDASDEDFELDETRRGWVEAAFPDLDEEFDVKFKDDDGAIVDDEDIDDLLDGLINGDLGLAPC